jgi:hypothetical protein
MSASAPPGGVRAAAAVAFALGAALALPARAQDADLDPLLLALEQGGTAASAQATAYQVYRVSLAYAVREQRDHLWGLNLTFPVSLGANEITASTSVGDFVERIQTLTITPGLELLIPAGSSWVVKPYGEAGFRGASVGGSADATLAIGVRSVAAFHPGVTAVTVGLGARYASPRTHRDLLEDYTSLEVGVDSQWSLGLAIGGHDMSGGVYAVTRYFPDLSLPDTDSTRLAWTHEVGISVAGTPMLAVLGVKIPWVGLGYRFGDAFRGVRLNLSFPF